MARIQPKKTTIPWHINFLELLEEDDLRQGITISLLNVQSEKMMIFLTMTKKKLFEVKIYKAAPSDSYFPHPSDEKIYKYIDTDAYAVFIFKDFLSARAFLLNLSENHPEYSVRPVPTE